MFPTPLPLKKYCKLYLPRQPPCTPDDVLNITIQTLDPSANSILNQGNLPVNSGAVSGVDNNNNSTTQAVVSGYLVNKGGLCAFALHRRCFGKRLTTDQVKDLIVQKISVYFKDPVVNVRFTNFKITVLGEVRNPTTFLVPNENPLFLTQ
jgi:polysaccharide export outer membrane protein